MPGVGAALRRLHDAGYALVVVSSQSCVGYGYVTCDVVDSVFDRVGDGANECAVLIRNATGVTLERNVFHHCQPGPLLDQP